MYVPVSNRILYDGTNGAAVAAFVNGASVISDDGEQLWLDVPGYSSRIINLNNYAVVDGAGNWNGAQTQAFYDSRNVPFPELVVSMSAGTAAIPLLLPSGTADVAVDVAPSAFPDASYVAAAVIVGITGLVVTAVVITDADTVTVTVENPGAVSLSGATVIVYATRATLT